MFNSFKIEQYESLENVRPKIWKFSAAKIIVFSGLAFLVRTRPIENWGCTTTYRQSVTADWSGLRTSSIMGLARKMEIKIDGDQ